MKKFSLFLIVLIFSQCSPNLALQEIENNETIFVLFEKSNSTRKHQNKPLISTDVKPQKTKKMDIVSYHYNFKDTNENKSDFYFRYSDYNDFDDFERDIRKKIKFKADKSFLKKNKNQIITNQVISKYGVNRIRRILEKARTIFLIDKDEIKNGEILIRQVNYEYYSIE